MNLKNKTTLVTGGAGIIGKELINYLVKKSEKVICIDREERPAQISYLENYIKKDLNHMKEDEIININPDVIFHLAATFERTEETPGFWEKNYVDNIKQTQYVLTSAKKCSNLKRFVFASSYLIYDENEYLFKNPQKKPIALSESSPIGVRNITGASKYYTEQSLKYLGRYGNADFDSISARIFRVYGKYSRDFLSRAIRDALNGKEINLYKKEGIFDYVYAKDVAEGLLRLCESDLTGIINLGSGIGNSVEEAINIIKKEIPEIKINEVENDILYESSVADIKKLKKELSWKPETTLEKGLIEVINSEK